MGAIFLRSLYPSRNTYTCFGQKRRVVKKQTTGCAKKVTEEQAKFVRRVRVCESKQIQVVSALI